MMNTLDTPRVYAACYDCYAEGVDVGQWLDHDALLGTDGTNETITGCSNPEHGEWTWGDSENTLIDIAPDEGAEDVEAILEQSERALNSTEIPYDVLREYVDNQHADAEALEGLLDEAEDTYNGEFEDGAEAAEHVYDLMYGGDLPDWLVIDWEGTWDSNLRHDYTEIEVGGRLHLFDNV